MPGVEETGKARWLLLLAVAGLALIAAMVAFLLHKERSVNRLQENAVYETNAVQHLRNISTCQYAFRRMSDANEYATLPRLAEACTLLDERFKSDAPEVDGYVFRLQVSAPEGERGPFYSVNADPNEDRGGLHFYIDSSVAGVRQTSGRPATPQDRPRE